MCQLSLIRVTKVGFSARRKVPSKFGVVVNKTQNKTIQAVVPEQSDFYQFVELAIPKVVMVIKLIYPVWFVFGMNLISGTIFY